MSTEFIADRPVSGPNPIPRPYIYPGWPNGVILQSETWFDGAEGRPWATCSGFPENTGPWAHFHTGAQFQFVISGSMRFPDHTIHAPGVHYADHCVPYGPFIVSDRHRMFILRPARNRQVYAPSAAAGHHAGSREEIKRLVNRSGRYMLRSAQEVEWESIPGRDGRRKVLIPDMAEIIEGQAGMDLATEAAPYGQYQIVLSGSTAVNGRSLGYKGLRFVKGKEPPAPLRCGTGGAVVAVLTFDKDAEWTEPGA